MVSVTRYKYSLGKKLNIFSASLIFFLSPCFYFHLFNKYVLRAWCSCPYTGARNLSSSSLMASGVSGETNQPIRLIALWWGQNLWAGREATGGPLPSLGMLRRDYPDQKTMKTRETAGNGWWRERVGEVYLLNWENKCQRICTLGEVV